MKKLITSLLTLAFLTGGINFNPKVNEEKEIREESLEVKDDPARGIAMQNSSHLKSKNVPIDGILNKFVALVW